MYYRKSYFLLLFHYYSNAEIIEDYLSRHADFAFDAIEVVNNRPMNIWLYAKCRSYVDPENPDLDEAEVEIAGPYDGNPTGG